jgi:hypothetical protein
MSEQPIQDINDGKPWSEMDLFDLRNSLAYGRSIEEVAGFLCRSGTVEEVRRNIVDVDINLWASRRSNAHTRVGQKTSTQIAKNTRSTHLLAHPLL